MKGFKIDIFLILFLVIVGVGSVSVYFYYLREKHNQLMMIEKGICPKCKQKAVYLSDQRGASCGPKMVTYSCMNCGYENSFNVDGSCEF